MIDLMNKNEYFKRSFGNLLDMFKSPRVKSYTNGLTYHRKLRWNEIYPSLVTNYKATKEGEQTNETDIIKRLAVHQVTLAASAYEVYIQLGDVYRPTSSSELISTMSKKNVKILHPSSYYISNVIQPKMDAMSKLKTSDPVILPDNICAFTTYVNKQFALGITDSGYVVNPENINIEPTKLIVSSLPTRLIMVGFLSRLEGKLLMPSFNEQCPGVKTLPLIYGLIYFIDCDSSFVIAAPVAYIDHIIEGYSYEHKSPHMIVCTDNGIICPGRGAEVLNYHIGACNIAEAMDVLESVLNTFSSCGFSGAPKFSVDKDECKHCCDCRGWDQV